MATSASNVPASNSSSAVCKCGVRWGRSVLQESERVLEMLQKQEENMAQVVTQRAKDLRDKELKLPYQKPVPCLAEKDACFTCYNEYFKDHLKCGHLVKDYADCVRRVKQEDRSADK